jgi:hypothetical protein
MEAYKQRQGKTSQKHINHKYELKGKPFDEETVMKQYPKLAKSLWAITNLENMKLSLTTVFLTLFFIQHCTAKNKIQEHNLLPLAALSNGLLFAEKNKVRHCFL